jgi:hypothetical protein
MSRGKGRIVVCVGLGAVALIGCGQSSRDSDASAGGDSGNEPRASGGSIQAGAASGGDGGETPSPMDGSGGATAGQTNSGGTAGSGGMGGDGSAGDSAAGAGLAGTAGSSAGHGGLGGGSSGQPGIVCGAYDHTLPDITCGPDEVCVFCLETEASGSVHCAPHPVASPGEYDAFLANCAEPSLLTECDGPEDCPDATLCQLRDDDDYAYAACSPEPPSCNAYCVACNTSADCTDGQSCVPNELGVRSWLSSTCGPPLSELLTSGHWLIGWSGGLDHFAWFQFTQGDANPNQGTVRTLPVTCVACESLSCTEEAGVYEIEADEVRVAFPNSCSLSFRFTNLASPAERLLSGGAEAAASAQVFVGVELGPSFQALLYEPGVACDALFTTCSFPPP